MSVNGPDRLGRLAQRRHGQLRNGGARGPARPVRGAALRLRPAHRGPRAARLEIDQRYLSAIGGSALTDSRVAVPDADLGAAESGGIPLTYVPFRNAHFLAAAVSWAEVLGATSVWVGAVEQDSSGYPDCRPAYYRAFERTIEEGTRPETHIRIETPLIGLRKSEIVRLGLELDAPLAATWSCYRDESSACGRCDSCALRLRAFAEAGLPDPISYAAEAAIPDA